MTLVFLTGTVSFLVVFAILGQDDKDQLTTESATDFTVRILNIDNKYTTCRKKNSGSELSKVCAMSLSVAV